MAQAKKRITASDILANFQNNVPDSRAVVRRLNVLEQRKREDENAKLAMIDSIRKASNLGAEAERKFSIAKKGDFTGNFWDFLMNPETSQAYYETGLDKLQVGEVEMEDNFLDKFGKLLGGLFNPTKIAQPDTSVNALGTLNPNFKLDVIEEGGL